MSAHIFIDSFSRRANGAVANPPLWRQDSPGSKNRKENKRLPVIDRWMYRNLTPPPAATGSWGAVGNGAWHRWWWWWPQRNTTTPPLLFSPPYWCRSPRMWTCTCAATCTHRCTSMTTGVSHLVKEVKATRDIWSPSPSPYNHSCVSEHILGRHTC